MEQVGKKSPRIVRGDSVGDLITGSDRINSLTEKGEYSMKTFELVFYAVQIVFYAAVIVYLVRRWNE